jgi:hypothetical protein
MAGRAAAGRLDHEVGAGRSRRAYEDLESEMEPIFPLVIALALLLFVITPAIWSRDPKRRADAREVLRLLLSAFGRRSV